MTAYQSRSSLLQKEIRYELTGRTLEWPGGVLDLAEVKSIRTHRMLGSRTLPPGSKRCVIRPMNGRPIIITSYYFVGFGRCEDRSAEFQPFVDTLVSNVAAANPRAVFIAGMPMALWWLWAVLLAAASVVMPLAIGSSVIVLVGDNPAATLAIFAATLVAILASLIYFFRALRTDWPRAFEPR